MKVYSEHGASVHTWTELVSRIRFGTQKALGKSVSGARIHAVADRVARYATHKTGRDIRPGLARVAVDLEMDYRTVKAAVAVLVRTGLLHLVCEGARRGDADEYQLAIPVDLMDREDVEMWSPARYRLEVDRCREKVRGTYRRTDDLRGPDGPQSGPSAGATEAADESPAGASRAADEPDEATSAGATEAAETPSAGATRANLRPYRPPPPSNDHVHTYDQPNREDARTAVTGPRASSAVETPNLGEGVEGRRPSRPAGCPRHGHPMAAGTRLDGKPRCALCRAGAPATVAQHLDDDLPTDHLATVHPIHRSAS